MAGAEPPVIDAADPPPPALALRLVQQPPGLASTAPAYRVVQAPGLTIGRGADCDVVLPDPLRVVSRQHARITPEQGAWRLHCLSTHLPLWHNDAAVAPGQPAVLHPGDRLRLGGFELAVEAAAAPAPAAVSPRGRLDAWFDLDTVSDPLGIGTPGDPPAAMPAAAAVGTGHPSVLPDAAHPVAHATATAGASPPAPAAGAADAPALIAAFLRGAGIDATPTPLQLTPEWMQQLGELLRIGVDGALALLHSRATVKDGMGLEGTRIARMDNNPLKFAPDAPAALLHLLGQRPARGYMAPAAALRDTYRDLLMHHLAVMAGMRAAVFELFDRLGPDAVLQQDTDPALLARWLPVLHDAALWRRQLQQHQALRQSLDDDFETVFGRQFKRAYEAQARGAKEPEPPAR